MCEKSWYARIALYGCLRDLVCLATRNETLGFDVRMFCLCWYIIACRAGWWVGYITTHTSRLVHSLLSRSHIVFLTVSKFEIFDPMCVSWLVHKPKTRHQTGNVAWLCFRNRKMGVCARRCDVSRMIYDMANVSPSLPTSLLLRK